MSTKITLTGTERPDHRRPPGAAGLPARAGPALPGYREGWNVKYTTELTRRRALLPARRGVQRPDRRLRRRGARRPAAEPERLRRRGRDRPHHRADARRRGRGRAAGARRRRPRRRRGRPGARAAWSAPSRPARIRARMDRLLFGDNQFFGINHMSEEKARAQAMQFQRHRGDHRRARRRLRRGHPHLHVHHPRPDRRGLRPRPGQPRPLRGLQVLSLHALRAQIRQRRHRLRDDRRGRCTSCPTTGS